MTGALGSLAQNSQIAVQPFESTSKFHDRLIIKLAQSSNIHKAIIKHDHINRSHEKHYQKALDLHNSDMNYHRL